MHRYSGKRLLRSSIGLAALTVAMVSAGCSDGPLALTGPSEAPDHAVPASPATPSFGVSSAPVDEPFDVWNSALWSKGDHALGIGYLSPANVAVQNGTLMLLTPAGTYDGGEVLTTSQYSYGTYTARLKCSTPGGTVCAFFLYQGVPGKQNDEIDLELLGGTRDLWVTTWVRGRRTNQQRIVLAFDPAADYHVYQLRYAATAVEALVDGQLVARFTRKLPTRPMYIMANAWWPTWLSGTPTGGALSIDWITAGA